MVKKKKTARIGEILMLCLCVIFFIPFYYLLVNTFKHPQDATMSPMSLPIKNLTLYLYKKLTKFLFFYFLVGFMVPAQTTMIPLFNLMSKLGLQNSVAGMIILYSSWCNFALFMYQGFLGGVPKDLEEAARIDGANLWQLFWKIVFPLLKPVTTTIAIFDVMWIWNDFMMPYLFISSSDKFTLIMEVYKGVGQFSNNWTVMLCTMVIVLLPIAVFYIAMQRHIIEGITSGAVKG